MKSFLTIILVLLAGAALAQPVEEWVARYNGPGDNIDYASALVVDASGNVYVTGGSEGSATSYDYATIKYDSEGNQLWVARYNGPGNGPDVAYALALDPSGNVYVTGESIGSGTYYDYATIKYDSEGNQLWVARYNAPGNDSDGAYALALDASGNVYVTGYSYGSGTRYDYATIKYDPNGNQLWVARYNAPENRWDEAHALALDASGNVYVTGWSDGSASSYDYATIKYDSEGNQLWVARYNGPGNDSDGAYALTLDPSGNVYVTGWSIGSGTSSDYATIKYDTHGNQLWAARYNAPGNRWDEAHALALDASGNVYVTGWSGIPSSDAYENYVTIKYDPNGNQLWVARYNGPGKKSDEAHALALDASGNVYVTGGSEGSATSYDYATIKYDSEGNQLWVARYNGPGNDRDCASALALDPSGNVYVTGESLGSGTSYDYATIKYSQITQPEVEISITPHNPPIEIPPEGGSFHYDGVITNNTDTSVVVDAWVMVRLPNQSHYGPVKLYEDIPLRPHRSRGANNIRQNVPAYAPAGEYRYIAFVGDYPGEKLDSSYFDFTKLSTVESHFSKVESWEVFGFFEETPTEPLITGLHAVYPNPFNTQASISYSIGNPSWVRLEVFDILGRRVAILVVNQQATGVHSVIWDASEQASGVYFYRLTAGDFSEVRRMTLLK